MYPLGFWWPIVTADVCLALLHQIKKALAFSKSRACAGVEDGRLHSSAAL